MLRLCTSKGIVICRGSPTTCRPSFVSTHAISTGAPSSMSSSQTSSEISTFNNRMIGNILNPNLPQGLLFPVFNFGGKSMFRIISSFVTQKNLPRGLVPEYSHPHQLQLPLASLGRGLISQGRVMAKIAPTATVLGQQMGAYPKCPPFLA